MYILGKQLNKIIIVISNYCIQPWCRINLSIFISLFLLQHDLEELPTQLWFYYVPTKQAAVKSFNITVYIPSKSERIPSRWSFTESSDILSGGQSNNNNCSYPSGKQLVPDCALALMICCACPSGVRCMDESVAQPPSLNICSRDPEGTGGGDGWLVGGDACNTWKIYSVKFLFSWLFFPPFLKASDWPSSLSFRACWKRL